MEFIAKLEDTVHHARALAFDQGLFLPVGQKRAYYLVLANFRPFLVPSSPLSLTKNGQTDKRKSLCLILDVLVLTTKNHTIA